MCNGFVCLGLQTIKSHGRNDGFMNPGMFRRFATIATKPAPKLQARGRKFLGLDHVCCHLEKKSLIYMGC